MVDGSGEAAAPRRRPTLRMVAIPTLMVAVAAWSTWRYHQDHQTSWRGASVGMFAMVDAPANRLVRGMVQPTGEPADGPEISVPPTSVADERSRALVTPTSANLRHLAEAWAPTITGGRLLRVEVWATRFRSGPGGPAVRLELIGAHDVEPGRGP